ncbi:PepSY domain-containing protein [Shewanella abyssi]|uniref:PepSY-associated TM helix domain-containing protein n=1 Tax=Shewanella abyssi TaxID=311789 RepID=UPI00200F153C|nr:PepSY-associated TM helix domain-containing protein [Shewanella abyssi]MCL1051697.1 PepSY domain-containing protein [Shewanella abyssi]
MKENFFRSMTWLHTWVGLLVCWVLLLIFFAGTMSYYRHDISLWTKPELHQNVIQDYDASQVEIELNRAQNYLRLHANGARDWRISFPTDRKPYLSYSWQTQPEEGQRRGKFTEHVVTQGQDQVITDVRQTKGGNFFYRLHFDLHYMPAKIARWIVGFCTMFMLIALISGIVIHKRIFKDFFSFRRNKGSRAWLDAHNVSSVLALPYHLMITYTGLVTLMAMYMPWAVVTAYDGDRKAFSQELRPSRVQVKPVGEAADTIKLASLLPQVRELLGNIPIRQVVVSNPGDKNSRVSVYKDTAEAVTDRRIAIIFDAVDGSLLSKGVEPDSGAQNTHDTLIALHTGRFSEPVLRLFFFLCGVMGCAMIATGTLLWANKIRQKQHKLINQGEKASVGLRLVEGLNLTFIAGLPLAASAFFYANRLLPLDMLNRAQWEANSFFIALAGVAVIACFKRTLPVWRYVLALSGTSLIAIPLLNAMTSNSDLLSNINQAQWSLVGFDSMCLVIGLSILFARTKLVAGIIKQPTGRRPVSHPQSMKQSLLTQTTAIARKEA